MCFLRQTFSEMLFLERRPVKSIILRRKCFKLSKSSIGYTGYRVFGRSHVQSVTFWRAYCGQTHDARRDGIFFKTFDNFVLYFGVVLGIRRCAIFTTWRNGCFRIRCFYFVVLCFRQTDGFSFVTVLSETAGSGGSAGGTPTAPNKKYHRINPRRGLLRRIFVSPTYIFMAKNEKRQRRRNGRRRQRLLRRNVTCNNVLLRNSNRTMLFQKRRVNGGLVGESLVLRLPFGVELQHVSQAVSYPLFLRCNHKLCGLPVRLGRVLNRLRRRRICGNSVYMLNLRLLGVP